MSVTATKSYFEDFAVGMEFRHRRGRTLSQEENARWSLQTMNTAQSHWNIESMKTYLDGRFETPIVNAAIVIALAAGLTSGDMTENIFREDGLDAIRITTPVFAGDTLVATSTVLELSDAADVAHSGRMKYPNRRRQPDRRAGTHDGAKLADQATQPLGSTRRGIHAPQLGRSAGWLMADLRRRIPRRRLPARFRSRTRRGR